MRYSIDTSGLLDGWKRYYPPELFPGVWEKLGELVEDGALRASEEVLVELERRDDEVLAWARGQDGLIVPLDDEVQGAVAEILQLHPRLVGMGGRRAAADPFVIALARVHGCTVVTGESRSGNLNRPRIPDVCAALEIPCLRLVDLMREERWVFR